MPNETETKTPTLSELVEKSRKAISPRPSPLAQAETPEPTPQPTPQPTPEPTIPQEQVAQDKGFFQAILDDIVDIPKGMFDLVKYPISYTPALMLYRDLFWSPEERRSGVYSLGFSDIYEGLKNMATDSAVTKQVFTETGDRIGQLVQHGVPVYNWRDNTGKWNPTWYWKNHPFNTLLDVSVVGSAAAGSARLARESSIIANLAKTSPEVAKAVQNAASAVGKVGEVAERAPSAPFRLVRPTLQLVGKTAETLGVKERFAQDIGRLPEIIARRFLNTPTGKMLANRLKRLEGNQRKEFENITKLADDLDKYNFNQAQKIEFAKLVSNASTDFAKAREVFKLPEEEFIRILGKARAIQAEWVKQTERLIHRGELDRATAEIVSADIPIRFNEQLRASLVKDNVATVEELNDYLRLPKDRQYEIAQAARHKLTEFGTLPAYYPTIMTTHEAEVVAVTSQLLKKRMALEKQLESIPEELAGTKEVEAIRNQINELNTTIRDFETNMDRHAVRKRAIQLANEMVKSGDISREEIRPSNFIESLVNRAQKFPEGEYVDPNALTVGELAKRAFGFPFHQSVQSAIRRYVDDMTRHLSVEQWHRTIVSNQTLTKLTPEQMAAMSLSDLERIVQVVPVNQIKNNRVAIQKLLNAGYQVYSPEVYTNLSSRYYSSEVRFLLALHKLDKDVATQLANIAEGIKEGRATVQDFQVVVQRLFGTRSATGIPKKVLMPDLADATVKVAQDVLSFQERAKSANFYLAHPDIAWSAYWLSFPRPSLFERALWYLPVVGPSIRGLTNAWAWMVLAVPRFVVNNLVGHVVFSSLLPVNARNYMNAARVQEGVSEIFKVSDKFGKRILPQNTYEQIKDVFVSGAEKTFGYFSRMAQRMDEFAASTGLSAVLMQSPEARTAREFIGKTANVEKYADLLMQMRSLDATVSAGKAISGELRPVLAQLSESISARQEQIVRALGKQFQAHIKKNFAAIRAATKRRGITKEAKKLVEEEVERQVKQFNRDINIAIRNLEAAIVDGARSVWLKNPNMPYNEFFKIVEAAWSQLLRKDVFLPFLQSTMHGAEFHPRISLRNVLSRVRHPILQEIFTRASHALAQGTTHSEFALRRLLAYYSTKDNIFRQPIRLQLPISRAKGALPQPIDLPPIDLTPVINEHLKLTLDQFTHAKLSEMVDIAENNPLVFFGVPSRERRAVLEVALLPAKDRATRIKNIERAIEKSNPALKAFALNRDIEPLWNEAQNVLKDWVYYTGNVNPALRNMLAGWIPFHGYLGFASHLLGRIAFMHPIHAFAFSRAESLLSELSAKTEDDAIMAGKIYLGHIGGTPLYVSIRGADPWSQMVDFIEGVKTGQEPKSAILQLNPFVKVGYTAVTGRTVPDFVPVRASETLNISGRAWRFKDGALVRDGGLSILDRTEVFISELLRQYPWYEWTEDALTGYERERGRFFWNAKPFMYTDATGHPQPSRISLPQLVLKIGGFYARTEEELNRMRQRNENYKRIMVRDIIRRIRRAKTEEERRYWLEMWEEWKKNGMKLIF